MRGLKVAGIAVFGCILMVLLSVVLVFIVSQSHKDAAAAKAQSVANNAVIQEVRGDLSIHAHASADRVCAVAREIRYLVRLSPDVKASVLRRVDSFTEDSCLFIPPHISTTGP